MRIVIGVFVFLAIVSFYSSNAADYDRTYSVPAQSKRCIVEGRFSCAEYERVYSIQGVRCVEDCLLLSNLNKCKLSNRCVWDAGSGCFRKNVCKEISNVGNCRRWLDEVICR